MCVVFFCYILHFAPQAQKIQGVLVLMIIVSMTKYLIKLPFVYILLSELTLKNSSDNYVFRHIIAKIIGKFILLQNELSQHTLDKGSEQNLDL